MGSLGVENIFVVGIRGSDTVICANLPLFSELGAPRGNSHARIIIGCAVTRFFDVYIASASYVLRNFSDHICFGM